MLNRTPRRKPRTTARWMRAMSAQAGAEIAEAISRLKAETWAVLVDSIHLLETEADQLIEQALAGQAGYQDTERLAYARRQLAALRAEQLAAFEAEQDRRLQESEPDPDPDAGVSLVCVPWQVLPKQAVR